MKDCVKSVLAPTPLYRELQIRTMVADDSLEGGRRTARALLSNDLSLTALICATDWIAVGALRGLRESGLQVPTDISVAGFGNVTLAQFCYPTLTTVNIPRHNLGEIICDFLISPDRQIEPEVYLDPELVLRDSTGMSRRP
jgi:DNA-binding LacI/PurR family transcriptional regulator